MLKTILAALLIGSTAQALPTIPDGTYEGKANWQDATAQKGIYTVVAIVSNGIIKSTYTYDTYTKTVEVSTKSTSGPFFDVYSDGQKSGIGYCLSVQCNYSAQAGDVAFSESLTFWQGTLYRVGSKRGPGFHVAWEEALKKVM